MATVVLIDLSSIAHPIYRMSASEPDPNHTSTQIVAKVRAYASGQPHVAICCDSGRSFRKDLVESYKANRPEREEPLHHQIRIACERLTADGFPIWAAKGFEADDLIATGAHLALARDAETEVLVVSSDKDLLALVGPRVRVKSVSTGAVYDEAGVQEKFGVPPTAIRDYLTLVGDASDNVVGAKGIGAKRAAELLDRFGTLDALYSDFNRSTVTDRRLMGFTPALAASIEEFAPRLDEVRRLITMRTDVPIPFDEVFAERVAQSVAEFNPNVEDEDPMASQEQGEQPSNESEKREVPLTGPIETPAQVAEPTQVAPSPEQNNVTALSPRETEVLQAPAEYERQLDPRSMMQARQLSKDLYDARMFGAYGNPQAVLSTVMLGREMGLPAMASLRSIHVIEGKHSLAAALMAAIVLKSGLAEYFELVGEPTETAVTFETHRKGARNPVKLTHTIEMARQAWNKGKTEAEREASWKASGWGRNPTDMLVARCQARLARYVYPDLLAGMYTPEELAEVRDSQEAKAS